MATGSTGFATFGDLNTLNSSVASSNECPTYAKLVNNYSNYILTDAGTVTGSSVAMATSNATNFSVNLQEAGYAFLFGQSGDVFLNVNGSSKYRSFTVAPGGKLSLSVSLTCTSLTLGSTPIYTCSCPSTVSAFQLLLCTGSTATTGTSVGYMNLPLKLTNNTYQNSYTQTINYTNSSTASQNLYLKMKVTSFVPLTDIKTGSTSSMIYSGTVNASFTASTTGTITTPNTNTNLVLYKNCRSSTSSPSATVYCPAISNSVTTIDSKQYAWQHNAFFGQYSATTAYIQYTVKMGSATQNKLVYGSSTSTTNSTSFTLSSSSFNNSASTMTIYWSANTSACYDHPNPYGYTTGYTSATKQIHGFIEVVDLFNNTRYTNSFTGALLSCSKTNSTAGAMYTGSQALAGSIAIPSPQSKTNQYSITIYLRRSVIINGTNCTDYSNGGGGGASTSSLESIGEFDDM